MVNVTGVCRFCKQSKVMEAPEGFYSSQEEIDEEATLKCKCLEAKAYQGKKEHEEQIEAAKQSAKGTTFELFNEEYPDIENLFNSVMDDMVEGNLRKLQ